MPARMAMMRIPKNAYILIMRQRMARLSWPPAFLNLFALSASVVAFSSMSSMLRGGRRGGEAGRRGERRHLHARRTMSSARAHRSVLRNASSMFFCMTPVTASTFACTPAILSIALRSLNSSQRDFRIGPTFWLSPLAEHVSAASAKRSSNSFLRTPRTPRVEESGDE
jgi:hypothetical protein